MLNLINIYRILFRVLRNTVKEYFRNWRKNLKYLVTSNLKEKIIALTLALLTFVYVRYQNVEQRNLFVPLQIKKSDELTFVNDLPKTVSLFVSGTRSALNNLDVNKIIAQIDLSDINSPGQVQRSPILESIPEGIQVLKVNPQTLFIGLSNLEKKLLNIEPSLIGNVESGYRIQSIKVSPTRIWVLGPRDILDDLTKIETEPIEIEGLKQNKQISVSFNKNIHPDLKLDRERRIEVQVNIESEYIRQVFLDPVLVTYDFNNEWTLSKPLWVSNITFEIHKDDLPAFDEDKDLTFYFKTNGIDEPNLYTVKVWFRSYKKIRKINYQPQRAEIEVITRK